MLSRSNGDAADGAVDSWLERLGTSAQRPRPSRTQVRYVLDRREIYYVPRVELEAYVVTPAQDGTLASQRLADIGALGRLGSSTVNAADRTISRLAAVSGVVRPALEPASPPMLAALLELTIETGRLHWRSASGAPLTRHAIASRLIWRTGSDGRQRPALADRPQAVLLASKPLWYVDPQTAQAGPVDVGIAPELAAAAAAAPALTPAQAERSQVAWRRVIPGSAADPPETSLGTTYVDAEPNVVLEIDRTAGERFARLHFVYGEHVVASSARAEVFENAAGGRHVWTRRRDAEERALQRLTGAGFREIGDDRLALDGDAAWARFAYCDLPELARLGWRVEGGADPALAVTEAGEGWEADVFERGDRWFDLDLGVTISGERVALLPILVQALRERDGAARDAGEPLFVHLPSGGFAALPGERVARLVNALVELFDADPLTAQGRLALRPAALGALAAAIRDAGVAWSAPERVRRLYTELDDRSDAPVTLPGGFHGTLRPYQHAGVAWLQRLRELGFGAVLADDMGLGKTVQLLAHAAIERAAGRLNEPVLIVAPTSVVPNWRAEIARFTPALRVLSLTGADREQRFDRIAENDVVLTSYALLRRDAGVLLERQWSLAVLDEAQAIKNPASKGSHLARKLRARQHVALTGTPIENHLGELWSIFAFAVPSLLGDRAAFARRFRTPIEKQHDAERRRGLGARVRPFLLRRTKENVERDLPPKSDIVTLVELDGAQRDLYETIRLAMHARVREELRRHGVERSRFVVLDALLKLRQVCCDPRLVKLPGAAGVKESAKLEALFDLLPDLIADGRRILLFSQFTSMLDLIAAELDRRAIRYVELRGSTHDRETPVARFQARDVPLFLISLKAGGTGLNLTAADTVIHYDPWWNPAVERQATDRAHRIGQDHPVFVYRLVTVGTVEERVLEMQQRKASLAEGLFDDAASARLDPSEIEALLAP